MCYCGVLGALFFDTQTPEGSALANEDNKAAFA